MTSMYVELQTPLSEYSLVCRGCLADSGEMKNIREWGLTDDFCKLTDIMLHSAEGISELLCTTCEDTLMTCKRFKVQCQQSDMVLRNIAKSNTEEPLSSPDDKTNIIKYTFEDEQLTFTILAPDNDAKLTLPCPYNCRESYIKKKDLLLHLIKRHNAQKDYEIDLRYHCHHEDCPYNDKSIKQKWFTKRKFLNQHFNKVHKSKIFQCDKCDSSFPILTDFNRHLKNCNVLFNCDICNVSYSTNERLLVHLMRHHPDLHKQYKIAKKAEKRKSKTESQYKRMKTEVDRFDYMCDSPKRSFATQTLENTVRNDVTLPSWQNTPGKSDYAKTDEISTQTVFEDLISLKSHSEDDSLFFSETVSLSDIQTQTFPVEFGSRMHKETLTDPNVHIKETQTCVCQYESPKPQFKLFESVPTSGNLTSTQTQTQEFRAPVSDVLLSFNSAETQTCFDDEKQNSF